MPILPPSLPRPVLLFVLATLSAIALILLFVRGSSGLYGEDGPIEIASVVAFFGAGVLFVLAARDLAAGPYWQVPATLFFATGRELDLDKSLLSGGILKSRFYVGDFPLWEKLVGLTIVVFALWTALRLIRHGTMPILRAIRSGRLWPWLVIGSLALIVIAKGIDGVERKLQPFGIELSQAVNAGLASVEEWLELGVGVAVLAAVAIWAQGRARPAPEDRNDARTQTDRDRRTDRLAGRGPRSGRRTRQRST